MSAAVRSAYLFVHIPKTAGTSFRLAVEGLFPGKVTYDYALKSDHTWDAVRQHVYERRDLDSLRAALDERDVMLLGGHFHYSRYAKIFPPEQVIAFVREPVARVVSEYQHFIRHHGFTGTLLEFAERPRNRNLQAAMLKGAPGHRLALLGVTERYVESLELLQRRVGWKLQLLGTNRNPEQEALAGAYALSDEETARLTEWNQGDLKLYARANELLDKRLNAGKPFRRERGRLGGYRDGKIYGWALCIGDAAPVRVRFTLDGAPLTTIEARTFRGDVRNRGLHPTGYVGFEVPLDSPRAGTVVRGYFDGTDIELENSPLVFDV